LFGGGDAHRWCCFCRVPAGALSFAGEQPGHESTSSSPHEFIFSVAIFHLNASLSSPMLLGLLPRSVKSET